MIRLSIVIPCYNEQENIPLIISEFKKVISGREDIEIILVNNGSIDDSQMVLESELRCLDRRFFKVVDVSVNQGYGHGILSGLNEADGNILAWTHADMQTDPLDVVKALDLYEENQCDKIIVKGKRKKRKMLEGFFTFGMQIVVFLILGRYLDDINAQPKLFSKDFYKRYIKKAAPKDFSLDLYMVYQAKVNRYKILEVPVCFRDRIYGEAKGGGSFRTRIKLIKKTLQYVVALRRKLKSLK